MNREALRHRDFWHMAVHVARAPHDPATKGALADWLDEHDSPLRAHIFRHGVPEQHVGTDEVRRSAITLLDEPNHPRQLRGHSDWYDAPHDSLAHYERDPETYELFRAASLADHGPDRLVVRYTLNAGRGGRVRLVAPVTTDQIRQIGHEFEAHHAGGVQIPWNAWEEEANRFEHPMVRNTHTQEPQRLARITLSPPTPGPVPFGGNGPINEHGIHDETGKRIGVLRIQPRNDGKLLHIHWVGLDDPHEQDDANRLGPEAVRGALQGLAEHYPDAKFVSGIRGTGFRGQANAERVVVPIRRPTKLERRVVGKSGAIVNNQFFGPGFIAKVRQRIRDVAPKLAKLARPEGTSNFIEAIQANPEEPLGHLTFADWLEEHGMPGAHVVRAHASALHGGDTVTDRSVSGGVMDPNLLLLGPTPRIVKTGGSSYSKIKKEEFRERPATQLSWGGGMARIAMAHKADTAARGGFMDGRPVIHFATASTPEQLEHLISDWPAWAQKYARNTAGAHLRATQDPTQLARKEQPLTPVDLSAHGLVGQPVGDKPLTLGQLKAVEDRYGLKDKERLSNAPGIEKTTDDQPYTAKVEHIKKFIETISKKAMPTRRHLRILADPKVSDGEKLTHLVAQIGKDYAGAEHPPEGESWYGGQVSHLDRMLHTVAAKGKPHPLWGTLDPKTGELLGKDDPATNHPGLVLMKAIIAATSGGQNPRDNLSSAVRAWAAGRRAGHPILNLPTYNHEALAEWIDRVKKLHGKGPSDTDFDADLRRPGTTPAERGAWFKRFIAPIRQELRGVAPGFSAQDARVVPETGHVVWVRQDDRITPYGEEQPGAVNAAIPSTSKKNPEGLLLPKGWGQRASQVSERLSLLKGVYGHFAKLHPGETELATMRRTADWLIREHPPVEFDRMSEHLKEHTGELPDLKPHYAASKAIFGKGFTDEHNPELPGMFILGPKFGSFAMNLHSNDPRVAEKHRRFLTADMWWTRNFMRYLGRMKESPGVNDRRQMLKAVQAVTKKLGITPADLQADLWYHEQALYRMLGADADHVESLSYRDAANDLLDPHSPKALKTRDGKMVKLARPSPPPIRPAALVQAGIRRWSGFTPTAEQPSPGLQISKEEMFNWDDLVGANSPHPAVHSPQDFHDVAAVLAGRKPAALVGTEFLRDHPVGQELARQAVARGMEVRHVAHPSGGASFVGPTEHVHAAATAWNQPNIDHVKLGTALGYPKEAIQSFMTRIGRPTKLARPLQIVQSGETAHEALHRLLGTRQFARHGRTASIERQPDGDIGVFLHGHRIVTAHQNGQVTLDHHGYMAPTTRRFMEGFSGHPVSFAGSKFTVGGQPYENGTPYPPTPGPAQHTYTTVPHTDPELRAFVNQIRPDGGYTMDHTAAKVLADWLEEHGDWRHILLRKTQGYDPTPRTGTEDDHYLTDGELRTRYPAVTGGRHIRHDAAPTGAYSQVGPATDLGTGEPRVYVRTLHPRHDDTRAGGSEIHSVLTPDEYDAMRRDAATAGVHFPERP